MERSFLQINRSGTEREKKCQIKSYILTGLNYPMLITNEISIQLVDMISSIEISHALEDEVFLHYFFSHFIHLHLMGLTLVLTIALNDLMISGAKKDHPFYRS